MAKKELGGSKIRNSKIQKVNSLRRTATIVHHRHDTVNFDGK